MVDMAMEDEDDVEPELEDDDPEQPGGEAGVLLEEAADSEEDREEQGEVGEAHGGERPAAAGQENKLKIKQNLIKMK